MPWVTGFTRLPPLLDPAASPDESLSTELLAWSRAVLHDTFSREVGDGWGTPDVGNPWVLRSGQASNGWVDAAGAHIVAAPSAFTYWSAGPSVRDSDLRVALSFDVLPSAGAPVLAYASSRRLASGWRYECVVELDSSGLMRIALLKAAPTETFLVSYTTALSGYVAGQVLWLRFQTVGVSPTTLRARVWLDGTTEPATWLVSTSDSSVPELQVAGDTFLGVYSSGVVQPALSFDNLSVIDLAALGGAASARFEAYRIYRTANGERVLVDEVTDFGTPTLLDWEAPTGVPLVYELTQYDGWQESVAAVVQSQVFDVPRWFLVIPDDPTLTFPLQEASLSSVRPGFTRVEGVRMSARYPLGRSTPIVWTGPAQRPTGEMIVFVVRSQEQIERVRAAAKASRLEYAVLKTGRGEALAVKLGAVTETYRAAGLTDVAVPYIAVR